jgi:hypothetical protein
MSVVRAYHGMPVVFRAAGRLSERMRTLLFDVALGWALIPGPLVGSIFGTLSPVIFGLPISSFTGGLLGLVIGPVAAAVEGVLLVSLFALVYRIVSGRSLFGDDVAGPPGGPPDTP